MYNPTPTRAWSRVQNPITESAIFEKKYIDNTNYKGNILQYKGNSSRITQNQKYTQLAKGLWCNRKKTYATQSETYSNPNVNSMHRVNYTTVPYNNNVVGQPNNSSGRFQYHVPSPFGCSNGPLQDGGNLVCGTHEKPCTGVVTRTNKNASAVCAPSYYSDVPGAPQNLCWDPTVQNWFPRQRYIMTNSGTKWPQGYKGIISALNS